MCDMVGTILDNCVYTDDLLDFLCDFDEESTDGSENNSNSSDSSGNSIVSKKRKSRSRYDAPKVFKYDVRWSYGEMLNLVLNGCDPYVAYSFFKCFARPDMGHSNRRLPDPPVEIPQHRSIANFIKGWYITTITAPDSTFCTSNPVVRNRPDGTSTVSCTFVIQKTDVFQCPSISDENFEHLNVSTDDLHDADMQMVNLWNHTRRKVRAQSGLKAIPTSLQQHKVRRLSGHPCDISSREYNFLDYLENVSNCLVLSPSVNPTHVICGTLVMTLDQNKMITSTEYVLNPL